MKSAVFAAMLGVAMAQYGGHYEPDYSPHLPHGRGPLRSNPHHAISRREFLEHQVASGRARAPVHAPAPYSPHDPHRSAAFMQVMQRPRSAFHDPLNRMNVNKPLGRAFDSPINLKGR